MTANSRQPLYQMKADFFKTLGHPARIRVLELLSEREHAVSEMLPEVGIEPANLTITLAAMVGSPGLAQVARQPLDRVDQVSDLVERGGAALGDGTGEALAHHIGFRDRAPARLGLDFGHEQVRQADG